MHSYACRQCRRVTYQNGRDHCDPIGSELDGRSRPSDHDEGRAPKPGVGHKIHRVRSKFWRRLLNASRWYSRPVDYELSLPNLQAQLKMTSQAEQEKASLRETDEPTTASAVLAKQDVEEAVTSIPDSETQARARLEKLNNDYGVSVALIGTARIVDAVIWLGF